MDFSGRHYIFVIIYLLPFITKVSAITVPWNANCGTTVGCFPNDQRGYLVTWNDTGSHIQFTLQAVLPDFYDMYLAIAFSDDRRMGDDSVVACVPRHSNQVVLSYNKGDDNDIFTPTDYGLSSISTSTIGGFIQCAFTRNKTAADSRFFNLNDDYILQLVVGEVKFENGGLKLGKHDEIPWFSDSKVDFQSSDIVGVYKLSSGLVKTHGIMMVLAWLLFSLVGMVTARYNRDMLPDTKLFGAKVWFQVHRAVMVAVVLCVMVGFITIFVEVAGYSQITPGEIPVAPMHPVLGIVVTCLTLLNPIGAMFRPGPDHEYRWIFNWVHFGLGILSQVLAVITIFFGLFLDRADLSTTPALVTGGHVVCTLFIIVFLEARKHMRADKTDDESTKINKKNLTVQDADKSGKPSVKTNVPLTTLIVFAILACAFTVGILGIIATN